MSIDSRFAQNLQHPMDSTLEDAPSRKRHRDLYDVNAMEVNENVFDEELGGHNAITDIQTPNTDQWDAMFQRLAAYKAEKGDCFVPKRYSPDPKLGTWVETQRVQYKRLHRDVDVFCGVDQVQPNKRSDQTRIAKLNSIGFAWSAKIQRTTSPDQNLHSIQENPIVPPKSKSKKLGVDEKGQYIRNRDLPLDPHWDEMYERLVKYKDEYGDTLVPRKYEKDPRLAAWVEAQRTILNRGNEEGALEAKVESQIDPFQRNDVSLNQNSEVVDEMDIVEALGNPVEFSSTPDSESELTNLKNNMVQMPIGAIKEGDFDSMPLSAEVKRLSCERTAKLDELGFVWSLRTKRFEDHWDDMFQQLLEYKNQHNNCLVPSRYADNLKLGKWVETQRYEYNKLLRVSSDSTGSSEPLKRSANPRLTDERRRRLESIGFEWKVRKKMKRYYDKQWDQMLDRLLEFKAKHGHCLVPKRYPDDVKLGTWVHTQRIQYRKLLEGTKSQASDRNTENASQLSDKSDDDVNFRLTDDRRKRLSDVGFVWSAREADRTFETNRIVRTSYDDQWDEMFDFLKTYKETYGNCLVPKRYLQNPKLGTWVDTQRVQYKRIKGINNGDKESGEQISVGKPAGGRLTEERIRRLDDLEFVWSLRDDWQKHYDELREFKKERHHCNVPARYASNRRLGIWVSAQRQKYKLLQKRSSLEKKNVRLTEERIGLLNDLGFTWTIRSRDTLDWAGTMNQVSPAEATRELSTGIDALQKASTLASAQLADVTEGTGPTEDLKKAGCYGV